MPRTRWLGVTSSMLAGVPRSSFQRLSSRDASLLPGLRRRFAGLRGWLEELEEMEEQVGVKLVIVLFVVFFPMCVCICGCSSSACRRFAGLRVWLEELEMGEQVGLQIMYIQQQAPDVCAHT